MTRTVWTPPPWPTATRITRLEQDRIALREAVLRGWWIARGIQCTPVPQFEPHISIRNMNAGRA